VEIVTIHLNRIGSTQDWMREWAQMGAREGLMLVAREQTAGRGRLDHSWESMRGGLYLSVLLRPAMSLAQAQQLTMLVSLAAMDACWQVAGVRPRAKWPNDLLLGRQKLAGVLTELESDGAALRYAIIGLGLNVNNDFSGTALAKTAISLQQATRRSHDIAVLSKAFAQALAQRYADLAAGVSPHYAWARGLEPLGRQVTVRRASQPTLHGRAESVSSQGALLVRDAAGGLHTIWAGDVQIDWEQKG
jgi:BirA family biotin operon repressor/biotin-[acetyl-CoA-carboxylase] ligase